jgi:EpsI family protein
MLVFFFVARYLPTAPERELKPSAAYSEKRSSSLPALLAAIAALSIGPVWLALAPDSSDRPVQSGALASVPGWDGPNDLSTLDWAPVFEGADSNTMAEYRNSTSRVEVFAAAYHEQHQGKELVGYANTMVGDLGAAASVSHERLQAHGGVFNSNRLITRDGRHALIVHYYQVGHQITADARTAQLLYGWQSLFSIPVSRAVGAYAVCKSDCSAEQVELLDLLTRIRGSMH